MRYKFDRLTNSQYSSTLNTNVRIEWIASYFVFRVYQVYVLDKGLFVSFLSPSEPIVNKLGRHRSLSHPSKSSLTNLPII
jgi:hypothetical protein